MSPAVTAEKKRWTLEEYLERERLSLEKHEYFDGEIFAMAGASFEHSIITNNVGAELRAALRGRCMVFSSDMRLFVPATGLFTYADASVLCGEPEFTEHLSPPQALTNPGLIVEVLSPTSEGYDRGKKFENYRSMGAFQHYLLIAQDRMLVEHHQRQPDDGWLMHAYGPGQRVPLPCEGQLAVDELYLGLNVPGHRG